MKALATLPPSATPRGHGLVFACALLLGAGMRLGLALAGHNYDMESYRTVVDIVNSGGVVYAETLRYNYGPIWFLVLDALDWLHIHLGLDSLAEGFHLAVAGLLTLGDVAISLMLRRYWGTVAALVFFFCPVSLIITGFHSQFDNLAVLLGLLSWLALRRWQDSTWGVAGAGAIMALSLVLKHVLAFFPLWVLMWPALSPRRRLLYCAVAVGGFLVSFTPWLGDPEALRGIVSQVLEYGSHERTGVFSRLLGLFVPLELVEDLLQGVPIFSGMKLFFLLAMLLAGSRAVKQRPEELFLLYLLALMALSPAIADQYLAIPLAACAVYWRSVSSWLYIGLATLLLFGSEFNLGSLQAFEWFRVHVLESGLRWRHAVVWLFVLLCVRLLLPVAQEPSRPASAR